MFRRHGNRHDTLRLLGFQEQASAEQIAGIVQALIAPVAVRTAQWGLGSRVDGTGGAMYMPERLVQLYHRRYQPWAAWMTLSQSAFITCRACGGQARPARST